MTTSKPLLFLGALLATWRQRGGSVAARDQRADFDYQKQIMLLHVVRALQHALSEDRWPEVCGELGIGLWK